MKILVSGCSFTANRNWPNLLFSPRLHDVKNLALASAGNGYISNSLMANLDYNPDFVFVLWSGINRIDLRVPNSDIMQRFHNNDSSIQKYRSRNLRHSRYYSNGGNRWITGYNDIRAEDWPEITSMAQWFDLPEWIKLECLSKNLHLIGSDGDPNLFKFYDQYFLMQNLGEDQHYRSELTFQAMMNCFNMLERQKIPYRFSTIYDMFSDNHIYSLGKAVREYYYQYVDWKKFIDLTPYEYGIKHDLISDDGFHLTESGYRDWAREISKILRQQPDLSHLF